MLLLALLSYLSLSVSSYAAPETWFEPIQTVTGNASSGFGSALSCSASVPGLNHSFIGIGAPNENSDTGRVYIAGPSGVIQTLSSNSPAAGNKFGFALTFIKDITGDGIPELIVGEPNPAGVSGTVHVFKSTGNNAAPYQHCAAVIGTAHYGEKILKTSNLSMINNQEQLIISTTLATTPAVGSKVVSYDSFSGLCQFSDDSSYSSSGAGSSRYGQSLAEVNDGSLNSTLLIGAPGYTNGGVYTEPESGSSSLRFSGSSGGNTGASIAASYTSSLLAFSSPREVNSISVQSQSSGFYVQACAVQVPMNSLSTSANQSLVHLADTFKSFVGSVLNGGDAQAIFASYRDEDETGGSFVLFGAHELNGCSSPKKVNNCSPDASQQQGAAIAGGSECVTTGGNKIIVAGAPGFSNGAGRVDVYVEGSESGSVAPCFTPTNTPTPSPTPTPTPTPSPTPSATPIAATATPTPTPGAAAGVIPVDPTTSNLPAPTVVVNRKTVVIQAPQLVTKKANVKLSGFQFTIERTSRTAASASEYSTFGFEAFAAKQLKKREILSRLNRITLRNLGVGVYTVSYRPVFTVKKGKLTKRVFGKLSAKATFSIS